MTVGDLMDKIAAEAAAEVAAEKDAYIEKLDRKLEEQERRIKELEAIVAKMSSGGEK